MVWGLRAAQLESLAAQAPALALELVRAAAGVLAVRTRANLERAVPLS